jgi:hypothetical protein
MMNTQDVEKVRNLVLTMKVSPVKDYVIPGLESALIGAGVNGTVRLFSQERFHEEPITPHSHRFDFSCLVLRGMVENVMWAPVGDSCIDADYYARTKLVHRGEFGKYNIEPENNVPFKKYARTKKAYMVGECYHMKAEEVHSIFFQRDALVLFFEGPKRLDHSYVLEPVSDGRVIPTFKVEPWMFRRDNATRK